MNQDAQSNQATAAIRVRRLMNRMGDTLVHDGLDFDIQAGEIIGLVGGSGAGKTVLLRTLLALREPEGGSIELFGQEMVGIGEVELRLRRRRIGMLFQHGALFGGLTVLENVSLPLREHTTLSPAVIEELALIKLKMAGLDPSVAGLYSDELSGGMIKRVALARALVMDPEVLFLDEPTAGLDPVNAAAFDELIRELSELLGLTVVMVTHDLDALWQITHRVIFLGRGKVLADGPVAEMNASSIPEVAAYFSDRRKQKEA